MPSLFTISEDLLALESLIVGLDGDITDPAADEAITAWLNELSANQATKCDGYINLIRKWQMEEAAAKAEAEQYAKAASVRKARVERLKARLKQHMELTNQQKIETATGRTIAIQANGGLAPLHIDANVNPAAVDPKFQNITISINNEAVRKAIAAGESLKFAQIGQRGTSLRIK